MKKKNNKILLSFVLLMAILLSGCIPPKYLITNYDPPRTIAVLPLENQTVDLVGAKYVRYLLFKHLPERGYTVIDLTYIDSKLNEVGITDGGQLSIMTSEKIGEIVGAEGLMYGILEEFKFVNVGLYKEKTVKANFKIFSSRTGELLWEDEREESNSKFAFTFESMGESIVDGFVDKLVEGAFNCPLRSESVSVVKTSLSTLPRCPKP